MLLIIYLCTKQIVHLYLIVIPIFCVRVLELEYFSPLLSDLLLYYLVCLVSVGIQSVLKFMYTTKIHCSTSTNIQKPIENHDYYLFWFNLRYEAAIHLYGHCNVTNDLNSNRLWIKIITGTLTKKYFEKCVCVTIGYIVGEMRVHWSWYKVQCVLLCSICYI